MVADVAVVVAVLLLLVASMVLHAMAYVRLSSLLDRVKTIQEMLGQFLALPQTDASLPPWFGKTTSPQPSGEGLNPSVAIPPGWDLWSEEVESGVPRGDVARPYDHPQSE